MSWEGPLETVLIWVGPVVALVGLGRLSERIEVSNVSETE